MRYCENCNQKVAPRKKFSIVWFLLLCLTWVGGIVYLVYYFIIKRAHKCPICGSKTKSKRWLKKNRDEYTFHDGLSKEINYLPKDYLDPKEDN